MNILRANKGFQQGLTLLELLLMVIVIGGIFLLPILFDLSKEKEHAQRIQCINNLKQVGLATRVWTSDHGDKLPWEIAQTNGGSMEFITGPNVWRHFQVMSKELSTPKILVCPADDSRTASGSFQSFNDSNISYFIGLGAMKTDPDSLLFGDRNLTNGTPLENGVLKLMPNLALGWTEKMHRKVGIVVVADGSTELLSTPNLRYTATHGVNATNRLLMSIVGP